MKRLSAILLIAFICSVSFPLSAKWLGQKAVSMLDFRNGHTATAYNEGKALICGEDDAGLGSADLYSIPFVSVEEAELSELKYILFQIMVISLCNQIMSFQT